MEAFFALLTLCEGKLPVTGGFPQQRPVTRSFDVFVDLRPITNGWTKNRDAGKLKHHRAYYDVAVMMLIAFRFAPQIPNSHHNCTDPYISFVDANYVTIGVINLIGYLWYHDIWP